MIELRNVSYTYGEDDQKNGIFDINLHIKKGDFIVITGSSGCGKTTITRLINGLIPNYYTGKLSGEVLLKGEDISQIPIYDTAKNVGSVFQNPRSQFFNVDTTSELAFAPENHGVRVEEIQKRINNTVSEFKIKELLNRSLFKLSGGEKQKIACACVSVAETDIIVLDEPSSNLDADTIEDLKRILALWKKQKKTIIIAEHRLYFLRDLADRMLIMKDGRIAEELLKEDIISMSIKDTMIKGLRPLNINELHYTNTLESCNNAIIEFSNFSFKYKDKKNGINLKKFTIRENAVVAIIGHNGAGKSTFAECLCGLRKSCKGEIVYRNHKKNNKARLKNCYMVMQDVNHQIFAESVLDEVLLSTIDKKGISDSERNKEAGSILKSLDLEDYKEIHPMALSGGQKQRVAIASAIASDRDIIIFDEPTSGLDYQHMNQVSENLKKLSQMNKTIFVITHDPELILKCCTDVLHLKCGQVCDLFELNMENEDRIKQFFCKV